MPSLFFANLVERIKKRLAIRSKSRKIIEDDDGYQLRDAQIRYGESDQSISANSLGG